MQKNTLAKTQDFRAYGFVLRRTNYGEYDRILNIITPRGKITAIAKSARKSKSKLAGNIEIFSLIDFNFHVGKSDFFIVTGAKMLEHYDKILKNYQNMELAADILKKISQASEHTDNPEFFSLVDQCFKAINLGFSPEIIKTWFFLNLAKASGEEINVYFDQDGAKLSPTKIYSWNHYEKALQIDQNGDIATDQIKILRLLITNKLAVVAKIKDIDELISPISKIAESFKN